MDLRQSVIIRRTQGYVKSKLASKTTVADPAEENYDIKYLKFDLVMDNTSTTITGNVITMAVVTAGSLPAYVFELDSAYIIDSVLINGVSKTVIRSGIVRTVNLSPALLSGSSFIARVYYRDAIVPGPTTFSGLTNLSSPSWGTHVTSTLSESYHAFEWWPCKQSLHDKIDSVDMWITVADSLKAGSNGILQAITPIDATHSRYEWKERNPIDHYLISVAVAPYIDYSYYMHFTGSSDSMLVQNYIYNNPSTLPYFKSVIDSTGMMVDYLSTLYGRYPFWQEKYGHCMAPINGGMEHQTMTTCGHFNGTLVAHELGHQWFGDNVTCSTWADIFMNEGFASYTEDLFIDHFRSHTLMLDDMVTKQTDTKSNDSGSIYVDDTTNENRIFDGRLSYEKGACMLHMLRFITNNDSEFFQVYKTYQQTKKNSTGSILDFKNMAESVLGLTVNNINLDTFFNQWAFLQGFPKYAVSWDQVGSDVYLKIVHTTSYPVSVQLFQLPIELRLHSATVDTTVVVLNDESIQNYHFTWSQSMLSMTVDPNHWLVYKLNSLTHDPLLSIHNLITPNVTVHPNPTASDWVAEHVKTNSELRLTDITGRELWNGNSGNSSTAVIPAQQLPSGLYMLQVKDSNNVMSTYKLEKE